MSDFWLLERRFSTLLYGENDYISSSRSLARALLFNHIKSLDVAVYSFVDLSDPEWLKYQRLKKVRFAWVSYVPTQF